MYVFRLAKINEIQEIVENGVQMDLNMDHLPVYYVMKDGEEKKAHLAVELYEDYSLITLLEMNNLSYSEIDFLLKSLDFNLNRPNIKILSKFEIDNFTEKNGEYYIVKLKKGCQCH